MTKDDCRDYVWRWVDSVAELIAALTVCRVEVVIVFNGNKLSQGYWHAFVGERI
jgi:hypothetical protein